MTLSRSPAPARVRRRTLLGSAIAAALALVSRTARARSLDPTPAARRRGPAAEAKRPIWIGHI